MLHTKFCGNRPAGSGDEDFYRGFTITIYEHGGHLGHVTWSCHQIFISLYLKAFIQSLVQINKVLFEKIRFEFSFVHSLGPMSRNDLDLQYSHIFITPICLRSLAAIVSEKSTVFTFSYRKA